MTDEEQAVPFTHLLIDVTVAGAIVGLDGEIVGGNVASSTLRFGYRTEDVPDGTPDEVVLKAIVRLLSPVLGGTQGSMVASGFAFLGVATESLLEGSHDTGETSLSDPVRVVIPFPTGEGRA